MTVSTQIFEDAVTYKLIYIMTIHDKNHEGFLKIGEATLASDLGPSQLPPNCPELNKAAHERIKDYTKTAYFSYDLLYTELAMRMIKVQDGTIMSSAFSDHDIHSVLDRSGYLLKRFIDTGRPSEWYYVPLSVAIKAIAAFKAGRKELSVSDKNAGTESSIPKIPTITLRDEQQECVTKTINVFKRNNDMLWNCKMRFGKTVTAYELIKQAKFQKVLVVTHRPVVEAGWMEDHDLVFGAGSDHLFVTKKTNGSDYEYDASIDSENDRTLRHYVKTGEYFVYFASMQDLRGSKIAGGKFDKNNAVFEIDWDLIIYDEAHEGTQTDLGQKVQKLLETPKNGKKPKTLSLSGTPYNILDQYKDDNSYTWDYVMEQKQKERFAKEHPDEFNPYADLPQLRIYTVDLQDVLPHAYRYETTDAAFNFREFFRTWTGDPKEDFHPIPEGKNIGDFVHEDDVTNFLNLISQESDKTQYPFATQHYRDMFRHTFWMVPGVKEAKALSALLKKHPLFQKYAIANVAGDGDQEKQYDDALTIVKETIRKNPYTITISCGRLTTGVTVPEWSAVMLLTGSASTAASGYMQTVFRVQSVGSINGKQKQIAYAFDFAPDRTLKILSEVHTLSRRGKRSDEDAKQVLGEFINYCPVIAISGGKMQEYDVPRMMRQLKKVTIDKALRSGFDDESIYNQGVGFVMNESDVNLFNRLASIIHGQPKSKLRSSLTINHTGLSDEQYKKLRKAKNKRKQKKKLTPEEKKLLDKEKQLKKEQQKVINLLRAVSIRLPMLIYGANVDLNESIRLQDFPNLVDKESWEEFMPQNLTPEWFNRLIKYYDEDVIIAAGLRIRRITKAADELPPLERIKRIAEIFSTFRNPDKETVLTPWRVVNKQLGDTIGGYTFYGPSYNNDDTLDEPRFINNGNVTTDLFSTPGVKLLEMNSKSGLYPLYLTYSLYASKLPDKEDKLPLEVTQKLWQDTLRTNIFVLCKTTMARSITRRTLVGYHDDWTIHAIHLPHLLDQMSKNMKRLTRKVLNPTTWGLEDMPLKFNAIVGNPPYQFLGGSGGTNDSPIYQNFADLAERLDPNYISLIIPARWFSGGRENLLADFRTHMLQNKSLRKMYVFTDSRDVFPTVEIKGGLCYYLYDKKYTGKCTYTLYKNNAVTTLERNLNDFDILIRDPQLAEIVKKIIDQTGSAKMVSDIISGDTPFGIPTNPETNSKYTLPLFDSCSPDHNTLLLYLHNSTRSTAYINRTQIKKNVDAIDQFKVFIPKASGSGSDPYVIGKPEFGPSNSVCSQTFLYAAFDSAQEAHNFISYLETKFFRVLVSACKISQETPSKVYRFVPMQDLTKSWTDDELYKKYGLTEDEISYIESNIKPLPHTEK